MKLSLLGNHDGFRPGATFGNELNSALVDWNFAKTKNLLTKKGESLITFARASSATYFDTNRVMQTATANVPRFSHNPLTGESLGLLVEEQRTNGIRNNTMVGAVEGTPGSTPTGWTVTGSANGINQSITGIGVENGITYIDVRISGLSTASGSWQILPQFTTDIAAASGQTWTGSYYLKLQAGSLANLTSPTSSLVERNSAGSFLDYTPVNLAPTSATLGTQRIAVSRALNNASTAYVSLTAISVQYASGVPIDCTLRIGLPQLEQGAFATSAIPTTTAAVTRAADAVSVTGSNFSSWYRQDEGTIYSAFSIPASSTTGGARVYSFSNSGATTQIWLRLQGGTNRVYEVTNSSTQQAVLSAGTLSAGVLYKGAVAIKTNDFGFSENGSTTTTDTSGTLGTVDRLGIGMDSSGAVPMSGHIRRIAYWPIRLSNATLKRVTR